MSLVQSYMSKFRLTHMIMNGQALAADLERNQPHLAAHGNG